MMMREIIESKTMSVVTGDPAALGQLSSDAEFVNLDWPIDAPNSSPSDSSHPVPSDSSDIGRLIFFALAVPSVDLSKSHQRRKF
jgi:hypothetical protein